MITAFILTPVVATLIWVYWYLLPRNDHQINRWRWVDSMLLIVLTLMAGGFVRLTMQTEYVGGGPIWPEIISAVGVYFFFTVGLSAALAWRRSENRNRSEGKPF